MDGNYLKNLGLSSDTDFRAKASFGVALTALTLLLPFAMLSLLQGQILASIGTTGIVILLGCNALLVYRGQCHQLLTLFVLVPAGMLFMITVFRYDSIIASLWCFPAIIGCYCMLSARRAWLANATILAFALPMVATSLPWVYSARVGATLLAVSLFSAILVHVIDTLNKRLNYQLVHDPLTGLFNRVTLQDTLEESISIYQANETAASLLAIDIDHFKRINDGFGHDVGDQALVTLAGIIDNELRLKDIAFRTGGEEFLVLLKECHEKEANIIAERLRERIERAFVIPCHQITISVGVAQLQANENWTQWMKRADSHLLESKRLGRNRVTLSSKPRLVSLGDINLITKSMMTNR